MQTQESTRAAIASKDLLDYLVGGSNKTPWVIQRAEVRSIGTAGTSL